MTRQEKVTLLNELLEIEEKNDIGNLTSTDRREFQQWVEDLEHKLGYKQGVSDVLDKIRTEIADLANSDAYGDYQQGFNFGLMRAAQIIDKYKAESEE